MKLELTSVFHATSPQTRAIAKLFYFDLAISALIFLIVAGLVVYVAIRFRQRADAAMPRQDLGDPKLETLWTVIPTLILIVLLVATAYTMHRVNPPVGQRTPDVVIVAHQWWWEFRYPSAHVTTANELHLPLGSNTLLRLESADVIHDFWVPDLAAKSDAIPGHPSYLWLTPECEGIFLGSCAEYCGMCHGQMGIRVIVEPPAVFAQWLQRQQRTPAAPPDDDAAQRGLRLFLAHTCITCHTLAGTTARGVVGPDLTHLAERQTLGAGVLTNDAVHLAQWIAEPQRFKEGSHMPNPRLLDTEARDIAAYLEALQ